jgi:acyl-coenzyme A synthetase/AMP-(fatty) acid ligase
MSILQHVKLHGATIVSSGTTGEPKRIRRTPENLKACNEVAIEAQMLTHKSKVYTCTAMDHAGGLLLQTLPAYTLGCEIEVTKFNPYKFMREFKHYTHTFLPPKMCQAIMKTKAWQTCDLTGKVIAMGSDPILSTEIQAFIKKGATVIANWGMSEIGPNVIQKTFRPGDVINFTGTILGDTKYCDTKIIDNELYVKGDICIYDDWLATEDMVYSVGDVYYYMGRKDV